MTRLFLDTEWQNDATRELVSLALVGEKVEFYAERDPLPTAPSSFVAKVVYPLLDRGEAAVPDEDFSRGLRAFLEQFPSPPQVVADAMIDFRLFRLALSGFGKHILAGVPNWSPLHVQDAEVMQGIELYFRENVEANARRHHALVDARALQWACELQFSVWGEK